MDEPEKLLRTGKINDWNIWRLEHQNVSPILRGADLRSLDLRGANLSAMDLRQAQLQGVNLSGVDLRDAQMCQAQLQDATLSGANLRWSNLVRANLARANLSHADLRGADLRSVDAAPGATLIHADFRGASFAYADLQGSDLSNANLNGTNLVGATLRNATVDGAIFFETIMADTDLMDAKGLSETVHPGPSIVDERTLAKSGSLPPRFLQGCGVSNDLINSSPLLYHSCFISFANADAPFAQRLYTDLQRRGVRCWFAPESMPIGADIFDRIDEEIMNRDKLVVILSKDSIVSAWVENEVKKALATERTKRRTIVMPIRLDGSIDESGATWVKQLRERRNIGEFGGWSDEGRYPLALNRLVHDLRANPDGAGIS